MLVALCVVGHGGDLLNVVESGCCWPPGEPARFGPVSEELGYVTGHKFTHWMAIQSGLCDSLGSVHIKSLWSPTHGALYRIVVSRVLFEVNSDLKLGYV